MHRMRCDCAALDIARPYHVNHVNPENPERHQDNQKPDPRDFNSYEQFCSRFQKAKTMRFQHNCAKVRRMLRPV